MSVACRVFVVEDDPDIRELIVYAFCGAGFDCVGFPDGASFFKALDTHAEAESPNLALLDIMLPGADGISILKELRRRTETKDVPIIMITAKSSEVDSVKGLDAGADDYVKKPFGVTELIARANAVLRRAARVSVASETIEHRDIRIDVKKREVTAGGCLVSLTYTEFELLRYLALNSGVVLTRDMIMDAVWGTDFFGESRTVDMHVKSLRKKLGVYGALIQTTRNVGYRLGE